MEKVNNLKTVFITGGTGYMGIRLIRLLIAGGHRVIALVRKGSETKVPKGAEVVVGNPFDARTFQESIPRGAVFVQLLGVHHPSPKKEKLFKEIDGRSVRASADAASVAGVHHFIYVSVAMAPSKLMQAYQSVRQDGEKYCLAKSFNCTFIRPWYVLGPGHWWPVAFLPFYGLAEIVPAWRKKARAMGLVTINQMLRTLARNIESKALPIRIVEIGDIRNNVSEIPAPVKTFHENPSYL